MPLEPALIALMTDTLVFEAASAQDKFGEFTYGPPVEVNAYITRRHIRVIRDDGSELTSEVQAILADPTLSISVNDRMTLPNGSKPTIVEVLAANDDQGPYYLEVRA